MEAKISIPNYRITDGWCVGDCETIQDCEDGIDILDEAIIKIDRQIAVYKSAKGSGIYDNGRDESWHQRAIEARGFKIVTKNRLIEKRTFFERQHRQKAHLAQVEREAQRKHDEKLERIAAETKLTEQRQKLAAIKHAQMLEQQAASSQRFVEFIKLQVDDETFRDWASAFKEQGKEPLAA